MYEDQLNFIITLQLICMLFYKNNFYVLCILKVKIMKELEMWLVS